VKKHYSTGAMAAAWFGTPGAKAAVDRVFPNKKKVREPSKKSERAAKAVALAVIEGAKHE
jgi:hypothetical protein